MAGFKINKNMGTDNKSLSDKAILLENKKDFDLRHIPVNKIIPNPENFYELTDIEELAKSIKEFGVMQNLEVVEFEEDGGKMYRLIAGHRRFKAIKLLITQGELIETIPCKVERNLTDIEENLRLIKSNSDTRELTQEEKRKQVEKLNELYTIKAEITGEKFNKKDLKELVASDVGMSTKQVERYSTINEKLIPQLQEYFDNERISFSEAIQFTRLAEKMQLTILDLLHEKDKLSNEEIDIIKKENKKLIEDNKVKELEILKKENELELSQNEKHQLESEKEKNLIEQEVIEEEKKKLEARIREEISQLTEEELNKLKEDLDEADKITSKLVESEKDLIKKLANKDLELKAKIKELEENYKEEEEEINPALTKEQLEKAVNKEKFKELKATIIQDIIKLAEIAKRCETSEVAEAALKEVEGSLIVYKNKTSKMSN